MRFSRHTEFTDGKHLTVDDLKAIAKHCEDAGIPLNAKVKVDQYDDQRDGAGWTIRITS